MTQSDLPLSDRLEQECARAGKTRQPVLLVGADRALLERVALRIHALTDANWTQYNLQEYSCPTMRWDWDGFKFDGPYGELEMTSRAQMDLALEGSIHFSDVQDVKDRDAEGLLREMYAPMTRARLIFSSTVDPVGWPEEVYPGTQPFLAALRQCLRIDTDAASGPAPGSIGLAVKQDDSERWIFTLNGKQYQPISERAQGFSFLKILCDFPGEEFSPKELRDRLKPGRTAPKGADTDRARVRNALNLVMDPKKNIPSEVRSHLRRNDRLRIGTVCVYRPVPE